MFVYGGDNQIEEVDGGGNAVARYVQGLGIDEPLVMQRGTTGGAPPCRRTVGSFGASRFLNFSLAFRSGFW